MKFTWLMGKLKLFSCHDDTKTFIWFFAGYICVINTYATTKILKVLVSDKNMFTFVKKRPHYKLKLACFAHDKTCQYFSEKTFRPLSVYSTCQASQKQIKNFCVTYTSKVKKNDSEAIMKFSFNKGTGINGDKFVSPR